MSQIVAHMKASVIDAGTDKVTLIPATLGNKPDSTFASNLTQLVVQLSGDPDTAFWQISTTPWRYEVTIDRLG